MFLFAWHGDAQAETCSSNCASIVISILRAFDIGQLALAFSAHSSYFSLLIPGTLAFTSRCDCVITPFSRETVDVVSITSGINPASPNRKLSFMLKQPA